MSPFINLYISNEDFLTALENWREFINSNVKEVKADTQYPVGQIVMGGGIVTIHFMHYLTFDEAVEKWNQRVSRMPSVPDSIGFMLTNWNGDDEIVRRFDNLPFKHKVIFTSKEFPEYKSAFMIKGWRHGDKIANLHLTQSWTGKRYIDQFDYVEFINNLV